MLSLRAKLFIYFSTIVIFVQFTKSAEKQLKPTKSALNYFRFWWAGKMEDLRNGVKDYIKACWQSATLLALDDLTSVEAVPVWDGVNLVRTKAESVNKWMIYNIENGAAYGNPENNEKITWLDKFTAGLISVLNKRTLKISPKQLADAWIPILNDEVKPHLMQSVDIKSAARYRRHRYNMLITMVFGVVAVGVILIPMGFQLLSVVSGKSLLLAKMALLLASINALKWVADSGVHYGLYHVPGGHYGSTYYNQRNARNVPGLALLQPTEEIGI